MVVVAEERARTGVSAVVEGACGVQMLGGMAVTLAVAAVAMAARLEGQRVEAGLAGEVAGLVAGDVIEAVNGQPVDESNLSELMGAGTGPVYELQVKRGGAAVDTLDA